ncbi:hypothetical protein [Amaricoccus solimangrovi]|uniref:EthD family reductase n=1 Tax=Amaricoccus solimangrovi TaxID=2589815 RepID=A0A501WRA9_9RHOB|nr:hypothetical protein [Amaricoccus solimangrovi]TPE49531.1 hypothetical protein FJM51_14190 [Amaricoccus solimangrovi]
MIVRQALFEGAIHPGREADFDAYIARDLLPLWRRFPGAREVRVLRERERDAGMPEVALALSMAFDDMDALRAALDSDVRHESREVTKGLLAMFDGRVRHHVFELAHG